MYAGVAKILVSLQPPCANLWQMEPRLFGPSQRALFGAVHEPRQPQANRAAVLLCHAGVHEYMRTHWAMRRLADALADGGHVVMRFDYSGTGDSSGRLEDATIEQWVEDITVAHEELSDICGHSKISFVGLRLGALLAAMASSKKSVERLVLWDPVTDGDDYLSELRTLQAARQSWSLLPADESSDSLLGYQLTREMERAIGSLAIRDTMMRAKDAVVVNSSQANATLQSWLDETAAESSKLSVRSKVVESDAKFARDTNGVMLGNGIVDAIREALVEPLPGVLPG